MDEESYSYLKKKILKLTAIDLDDYKSQQMKRRLGNFINYSGTKSIVDYCHIIEKNPEELRKLLDFITINVSEFFRDLNIFQRLYTDIIPDLLNRTRHLNIWSAGCSRGQEPYSIAMLMQLYFPDIRFKILATDIDEGALTVARAGGPYTSDDLRNLPVELQEKYIRKESNRFFITDPAIHRQITFKKQNLLNESFDTGFHLIICRNVTIYFTEQAKKTLNLKFYQSLLNYGFLFIGGTEVMLDAPQIGFKSSGICFYQKNENFVPSADILAGKRNSLKTLERI